MYAYGYIHAWPWEPVRRMPKPRHARYSQADRQLERLLIEASVTLSLLCPIDGYQHSRWSASERQRPQSIDVSEP